jgi:hypothetical protein
MHLGMLTKAKDIVDVHGAGSLEVDLAARAQEACCAFDRVKRGTGISSIVYGFCFWLLLLNIHCEPVQGLVVALLLSREGLIFLMVEDDRLAHFEQCSVHHVSDLQSQV